MNNEDLLNQLQNDTTVIKITDNLTRAVLFEKQFEMDYYPAKAQFKDLFDFSTLESHWNDKWASFGTQWTHERQVFRFLWYEVRAFAESYKLYKENFTNALNLSFERDSSSLIRINQYHLRAELGIRSMYEYGKQAIDLLRQLSQYNQSIQIVINEPQKGIFLTQFRETRNKFLIHYHNPHRFQDLVFDPNFTSVMGTGSLFEVKVHIQNLEEKRYSIYINHYADYFKLEETLTSVISQF